MRLAQNVSALWQLCSAFSLVISSCRAATPQPRVAIIGAGVGGTFNAYFNRNHLGSSAIIDVYVTQTPFAVLHVRRLFCNGSEHGGVHPKIDVYATLMYMLHNYKH